LRQAIADFASGRADSARSQCEHMLSHQPRHAGALHLLGLIAHRANRPAEATELLRRAAESPGAIALYMLSYAELGCRSADRVEALRATRRAVALDPGFALAWFCLGNLLQETGPLAEALAAAETAQSLDPEKLEYVLRAADIEMELARYWPAIARLEAVQSRWGADVQLRTLKAHLLRLVDQNEAAVALCNDTLASGSHSAELLRAQALALQLTGEHDLALASFDRAAATPGAAALTSARACSDKAVLLAHLGRTEAAAAAFDAALRIVPTLADAWYNKTNTQSHRRGDADLEAMERLLTGCPAFRDRLLLHFALGKAYADSGDTERAWGHWQHGNALKRATLDYDADTASAELASIASRPLDRGICASASGSRLSQLPVFIVGMPRSGSSLIEQILASHPAVAGGGELLQLRALFERPPPQADPTAAASAALTIADSALARLRTVSVDALRIVDKDLENFRHLGVIHQIFPRARIIHCRRDPIETCFSAYTKLFVGAIGYAYRLDELGRYYRDYDALMRLWRSALPPGSFLEVDYERLVREPDTEIRRLIDFIGLPWDDACLRFFETPRRVSTSSFAQVRRPIYATSLRRSAALRDHLGPLVAALHGR